MLQIKHFNQQYLTEILFSLFFSSLWNVKHQNLKGNFAIFYMLAKYVPDDIKYIFTVLSTYFHK
jgi:hypothetical protein